MHIFPEETEKKIMEDICIDGQIDISIVASNVSGTPFQTIEKFRNGSQNVLTMVDPFEAFSKMISEFLTSIITNTYADKRDWDISIIELISKGLN